MILHFSSFPSLYGWIFHKASLHWALLPSLPSSSCKRLPFFTDYLLSSPFRTSAPRLRDASDYPLGLLTGAIGYSTDLHLKGPK